MSCDCYKIGGPWIAEDPDCPAHGREAQRREREQQERQEALEAEKQRLETRLQAYDATLLEVAKNLGKMLDVLEDMNKRLRKVEGRNVRFK